MLRRQGFGLQAVSLILLTVASRSTLTSADDGVRSCLPLRDSSGFAPDSLLLRRGAPKGAANRLRLYTEGDSLLQYNMWCPVLLDRCFLP